MNTRQRYLINLVLGVVVLCLAEVVLALSARAQNQNTLYEVIDVGPFGSPRFGGKPQINNPGQVVGKGINAFLWEKGVIQDLGTLPGGTGSAARGINNLGQVVGEATKEVVDPITSANSFRNYASLWENGVTQNLGTLAGGNNVHAQSSALDINDRGQVVGYSDTPPYERGGECRTGARLPVGESGDAGPRQLG